MKVKKYWILVAGLAICVFALILISREIRFNKKEDKEEEEKIKQVERGPLAGLKGIYVVIVQIDFNPPLSSDAINDLGLSRDSLRTFIEFQLRGSGVPVFFNQFYGGLPPGAEFYLTVWIGLNESEEGRGDSAGMYISAEVKEYTTLYRNRYMPVVAQIWKQYYGGLVSTDELKNHTEYKIREILQQFINDYLVANPKTEGSKSNK